MYYQSIIIVSEKNEIHRFIEDLSLKLLSTPTYQENPDFLNVSPTDKQTIGIQDIKHCIRFASIKPYKSENKIIHIENANKLTIEAQNALLKLIEEPPANTQIILSCNNIGRIIDTIISRCQIQHIHEQENKLSPEAITNQTDQIERLKLLTQAEKIKNPSDKRQFVEDILIELIKNIKEEIHKNTSINTRKKLSEELKLILDIHKKIKANVNYKIALEYLFIKLDR
jgi:DNA polymerase III subunit delta'